MRRARALGVAALAWLGGGGCDPRVVIGSLAAAPDGGNLDVGVSDGALPDLATPDLRSCVLLGGARGFLPAGTHPTGVGPTSVVALDLDGDGHLDAATCNYMTNDATVLLGSGDGCFRAGKSYSVGMAPYALAAGRFRAGVDAAGLGLAVANYASGEVSVLLDDGHGDFTVGMSTLLRGNPLGITAADLDGDGFDDLAVVGSSDNRLSVLLGRGQLGAAPIVPVRYAMGVGPVAVAAGVLHGNVRDLVVAHRDSSDLRVLVGDGTGAFAAGAIYHPQPSMSAVVLVDLNHDGALDLAVSDRPGGQVAVMLGHGGGNFDAARIFSVGKSPTALVAGDFDGDGTPDLVTANSAAGTVSLLLGNGDGSFRAGGETAAGGGAWGVAAGDFNGDGKLDLVVADHDANQVLLLINHF